MERLLLPPPVSPVQKFSMATGPICAAGTVSEIFNAVSASIPSADIDTRVSAILRLIDSGVKLSRQRASTAKSNSSFGRCMKFLPGTLVETVTSGIVAVTVSSSAAEFPGIKAGARRAVATRVRKRNAIFMRQGYDMRSELQEYTA